MYKCKKLQFDAILAQARIQGIFSFELMPPRHPPPSACCRSEHRGEEPLDLQVEQRVSSLPARSAHIALWPLVQRRPDAPAGLALRHRHAFQGVSLLKIWRCGRIIFAKAGLKRRTAVHCLGTNVQRCAPQCRAHILRDQICLETGSHHCPSLQVEDERRPS